MDNLNNMERVDMKPMKMDPAQRQREAEFLKQASGDDLKGLFDQYRNGGKSGDLNMTEEEAKRIGDCFDKPEFMDLFREYVDDISDPKNMEEYDQYLRQLEEEGEIPEDEEVIRPEKGFVLKTKSNEGSKIFINCCGTDRVPAPTQGKPADPSIAAADTTGDKGKGSYWSVPYIHTAVRMDRDKSDQPCHVYDILFNTQALRMAEQNAGFKGLVAQTALESVEENGKTDLKDPATGKWDYAVLKNMKYKGNVVRPHKLKKDPSRMNTADKAKKPKAAATTQPPRKSEQPKKEEPKGPPQPKMTIIHRGEYDMSDSLVANGSRDLPISRRPKELVVKLELPLMASVADMQLDIKGGFLEFSLPGTYELKHKLPYPVEETTGDAKYSKTQKLLTVTLKVLPWTAEELNAEVERAQAAKEEAEKLAAADSERKRLQEEEEAAKAVKKGFLSKPSAKNGGRSAGQEHCQVEPSDKSGEEEPASSQEISKPLIEDLGECCAKKGDDTCAIEQKLANLHLETMDGGVPPIRFRQNQQNVTAVVRVQGIEESSLKVEYSVTRLAMTFTAVADDKRLKYTHTVHLASDIDPVHCRHDVSESNLVLVLRKAQSVKWDCFEGPEREPPILVRQEEKATSEVAATESSAHPEETGANTDEKNAEVAKEKRRVRWEDQAPVSGKEAATGSEAESVSAAADPEEFQPAEKFEGSKSGFVFQMGTHGLGYYKDKPLPPLDEEPVKEEEEAEKSEEGLKQIDVGASQAESVKEVGSQPDVSLKPLPKIEFTNNLMFDLD